MPTPPGGTYSPTSPKALRFCEEFLADLCASKAAERAGYAKRSARAAGCALMQMPEIRERIKALMDARAERVALDADYVLTGIREAAERCMQRAPVMVRRGKEVVQLVDEDDNHVWRFDSIGALKAFELLGKHLALFVEVRKHEFPNGAGVLAVPVPVGDAQWGAMAAAQQAGLAGLPPAVAARMNGNGHTNGHANGNGTHS